VPDAARTTRSLFSSGVLPGLLEFGDEAAIASGERREFVGRKRWSCGHERPFWRER